MSDFLLATSGVRVFQGRLSIAYTACFKYVKNCLQSSAIEIDLARIDHRERREQGGIKGDEK